jgi:hypothetical protein
MIDSYTPQNEFNDILNPGEVHPPETKTVKPGQNSSYDMLWNTFQKKQELAQARTQIEQDFNINSKDKESLLQDLNALEALLRNELIVSLHRNNHRQAIESLIAPKGHPALYFPEDGFYLDRIKGGLHWLN